MIYIVVLIVTSLFLCACTTDSSIPEIIANEEPPSTPVNPTEPVGDAQTNEIRTEIFESDNPLPSHLAHCQGLSPAQSGECIRAAYSDSGACDALDEQYRSDCFAQVAKNLGDVDICEHILDDMRKNTCYFGVALHLALNEEDFEYCELASSNSDRDECLWGYYLVTKDESVCSVLSDELLQEMCMN